MNQFVLTATALRRRKLRTLFTGLSVLVVFVLFGLAMALRHGFRVGPSLAGNNVVIVAPKGRGELPIGVVQQVASVDGVQDVLPFAGAALQYQNPKNQVVVMGVAPDAFLATFKRDALEPPVAKRWRADRTGALVMEDYMEAHDLHWQVGQTVTLTPQTGSPLKPLAVHIDGIVRQNKNRSFSFGGAVTVHLKYLNAWRSKDTIGALFVMTRDPARSDAVADAISRRFANSTTPIETQNLHALLLSIMQRFGNVGALTMAVIAAALLSLVFVTGNAMAQSVAERRAEFALLKALGFSRRRVGALVCGETALLTAPPALIGLGVTGWLVGVLANGAVSLPGFALDSGGYLVGIGATAGLIVVSSLAPLVAVLRATGSKALRR